MELKEGMYVRLDTGKIGKIVYFKKRDNFPYSYDRIAIDSERYNRTTRNVIKASYNIIDLIEVGDYVNGNLIEMFYDCWNDEIEDYEDILGIAIYDDARMDCIEEIRPLRTLDIKSIVTKEQFESMEYKL